MLTKYNSRNGFRITPDFRSSSCQTSMEQHLNSVFAHLSYEARFTILAAVSSALFWAFEWAQTYQSIGLDGKRFKFYFFSVQNLVIRFQFAKIKSSDNRRMFSGLVDQFKRNIKRIDQFGRTFSFLLYSQLSTAQGYTHMTISTQNLRAAYYAEALTSRRCHLFYFFLSSLAR